MTAAPSEEIRWYVREHDKLPDYPSSTPAGVNGDRSHFRSNSLHIGISELPNPGGYTNRNWQDQIPAAKSRHHASAIDTAMSRADMIREWNRYLAVFHDLTDPRRQVLCEYIGWNGQGESERLDFHKNSRGVTGGHKSHSHKGVHRMYYNVISAFKMLLSIDRGETKQQYLASIGQGGSVSGSGDEEMIMLCTVKGKATVWKGNGTPGTLMAVHSEEAMNCIISAGGSNRGVISTAVGLVDLLGTLPGEGDTFDASVTAVEAAG